jgi:hypothetical protein
VYAKKQRGLKPRCFFVFVPLDVTNRYATNSRITFAGSTPVSFWSRPWYL